MTRPKKTTKRGGEKDLPTAMQQAGFSKDSALVQNDFWARMGVTGVRIGRTTLKVKGTKK